MDAPCTRGELHRCRECGLEQPCRRFEHYRRKLGGMSPNVVLAAPLEVCKRCRADNKDEKRFADWWTPKASKWIGQHIPKFVRSEHLPAFADLEPSRVRITAQRSYLAEHYSLTPQALGKKFLEAWPSTCPGPCGEPFQGMQHGYLSLTGDRLRQNEPPYLLNIICLCNTCNGQKGAKDFVTWQEDIHWDKRWKEARADFKAARPQQLPLFEP